MQRNSTLAAIAATGLLNYDANDRTVTDPYDANGNLLNGGVGSNIYDFENHMVAAGGVNLVYDGDGNRVQETVAGVTTSYLVADQNLTGYAQVLDELQNGTVTRSYSYGLSLINEQQTIAGTPTTSFYGYDGHGSVRFLTSSTGAVTDTYDYDAFGSVIAQSGSTPNNYLFAGEQFDPLLGIYYNRARYYDQRQGRFWSMDTYEGVDDTASSLHKYLYVANNPVRLRDASGNIATSAEVEASAAANGTIEAAADSADSIAVKIFQSLLQRGAYAGEELIASGPSLLAKGVVWTLSGLLLTGATVPFFSGGSNEDVLLENGHNGDNYAIFAFGDNMTSTQYKVTGGGVASGPRAPRIQGFTISDPNQREDIKIVNGMVGPTDPPEGASTVQFPENTRLTGKFWGIPVFSVAAIDGISVIKDGSDQTGGHHTIFPTRFMSPNEFVDSFFALPWVEAGRKDH